MNKEQKKFIKVIKRRKKRKGHLISDFTSQERKAISRKTKSRSWINKTK